MEHRYMAKIWQSVQHYFQVDNMLNKNTLGVKKVRGQSEVTMVI